MRPNPTAHNAIHQLDRRKLAFDTANALGGLIGGWLESFSLRYLKGSPGKHAAYPRRAAFGAKRSSGATLPRAPHASGQVILDSIWTLED
jgi:hypothetical protein